MLALEVFVYRTRHVQVYDLVEHGHRYFRRLTFASDARCCLHEVQPSSAARPLPWPRLERHAAQSRHAAGGSNSVIIERDHTVSANLSLAVETYMPKRLLCGQLPEALLAAYTFWRAPPVHGPVTLIGYPNVATNDSVIHCQINLGGHVALHGNSTLVPQTDVSTRTSVRRLQLSRMRSVRDATLEALAHLEAFVADNRLSEEESVCFSSSSACEVHALLMELGRQKAGRWDAATASATYLDLLSQVNLQPLKKQRLRRRSASEVVSDLVEAVLHAYREEQVGPDAMDCDVPAEPADDTVPTAAAAVDEQELVLLDLLHAPTGTFLHSLVSTLSRIENISHILAWATFDGTVDANLPTAFGESALRFVMLPRLKLTFEARRVNNTVRLYSVDHAELFITNSRDEQTSRLLAGVPHSLILVSHNGEQSVLVPAWKPERPQIESEPYSTALVLNRADAAWNAALQPYFIYKVQPSLALALTLTPTPTLTPAPTLTLAPTLALALTSLNPSPSPNPSPNPTLTRSTSPSRSFARRHSPPPCAVACQRGTPSRCFRLGLGVRLGTGRPGRVRAG